MASNCGSIFVEFFGEESALSKIDGYIQRKAIEHDAYASDVNGWSFLQDYDPQKHEIESELIVYESLEHDGALRFFQEIAKDLPGVGIKGELSHSWLTGYLLDTTIEFSHDPFEPILRWISKTTEDDNEDNVEADEQIYKLAPDLDLSDYLKNKDPRRLRAMGRLPVPFFIELMENSVATKLQSGDSLVFKKNGDAYNSKGKKVGWIRNQHSDGFRFEYLAPFLDEIEAHATSDPKPWGSETFIADVEFFKKGSTDREIEIERSKRISEEKEKTLHKARKAVPSLLARDPGKFCVIDIPRQYEKRLPGQEWK